MVFLRRLVYRGTIIRIVVAMLLHVTGYATTLAPDEDTYNFLGQALAMYWSGEAFLRPDRLLRDEPHAYVYVSAASFYLFGSAIPLKILNCFLGAYCCRWIYLLARELFGSAAGQRAATLFTYFPSLVLWSSLNIRDIWVIGLILLVSWKSLQLVKTSSLPAFAVFIGAILLLTEFRDYLFFVVAVPPVTAFLLSGRGNLARNFILTLCGAIAVIVLLEHGVLRESSQQKMTLEGLSRIRQNMATGGSAFAADVDISTPGKAVAFLPLGIMYFLLSPFPWQITSLLKILSVPEMIFIYCLIPSIVRGLSYAIRQRFREALQILMLTALLTISYALIEGNVGTLYRHRAQAIGFYLIFAAAGLELRHRQRQSRLVAA